VFDDESDETGYCDVAETSEGSGASSSAPAPCASNDECPEGIECVQLDEGSPGFCDVDETTEDPDDSDTSSSAPAPCASSDECPEGIECVQFDEGSPGFCDVDETIEG
jgi:hypothetical protein